VNSDTQLTATAPASASGMVNAYITNAVGRSYNLPFSWYTYVAKPAVATVSPAGGSTAGGTVVTISGSSLRDATTVLFGSTPATSVSFSHHTQTLTAVSPPHALGMVDIIVGGPYGSSAPTPSASFTYIAPGMPVITGLSPAHGTTNGGVAVDITGTSLNQVAGVLFGSTPATSWSLISPGVIRAVSPAHAAGDVVVTLQSAGGTSPPLGPNTYTYVAPMRIA